MSSEAPHRSTAAKRKRDRSFSSSSSESYDSKPKKTKARDRKRGETHSSKLKKGRRSERRKRTKHSKKKAKSDTESETFSSSDDESSGDDLKSVSRRKGHKHKKSRMKHPKKEHSKRKHKHKKQSVKNEGGIQTLSGSLSSQSTTATRTSIGETEKQAKSTTVKKRGPMTKEEWEKQQSIVRRVYDPDTGRHRLVKGDGEIVEEIVSREQQRNINRQATLGDSMSFQQGLRKLM